MIFYYSATGNSYWVAKKISQALGVDLVSIPGEQKRNAPLQFSLKQDESVGFVFPIHAWNPPTAVIDFINTMQIENYDKQYVFSVSTCGDASGKAIGKLEKKLTAKGLPLNGKWDILMPDNYILMNEVDDSDTQKKKFDNAALLVDQIIRTIAEERSVEQLHTGKNIHMKSEVIGFFFKTFGKNTLRFKTTEQCIGCGLCAKLCPASAITMSNGKPKWKLTCEQCYACINRCPLGAIQVGKATASKGRYCHPVYQKGKVPT